MNKPTRYESIKAYIFVDWEVPCFDELTNYKAYKMMEKVNEFIKKHPNQRIVELNQTDEDWIIENIQSNAYFKNGSIPVMGWAFDFSSICCEYWVKYSINGKDFILTAILAPTEAGVKRYLNSIYSEYENFEILEIR